MYLNVVSRIERFSSNFDKIRYNTRSNLKKLLCIKFAHGQNIITKIHLLFFIKNTRLNTLNAEQQSQVYILLYCGYIAAPTVWIAALVQWQNAPTEVDQSEQSICGVFPLSPEVLDRFAFRLRDFKMAATGTSLTFYLSQLLLNTVTPWDFTVTVSTT